MLLNVVACAVACVAIGLFVLVFACVTHVFACCLLLHAAACGCMMLRVFACVCMSSQCLHVLTLR